MPGSLIDVFEDVGVLHRLRGLMDDVEDYWERKEGADLVTGASGQPVNHNLAIWGWDVRDTMERTVGHLTRGIADGKHRRNNVLTQITSAAGERSALLALTGGLPSDTPVTLAQRLGSDPGGIETLVVALEANNILGTVLDFEVKWSQVATVSGPRAQGGGERLAAQPLCKRIRHTRQQDPRHQRQARHLRGPCRSDDPADGARHRQQDAGRTASSLGTRIRGSPTLCSAPTGIPASPATSCGNRLGHRPVQQSHRQHRAQRTLGPGPEGARRAPH